MMKNVITEGFTKLKHSSTGDLNPLDRGTRPTVIVSFEAIDFASKQFVEALADYRHNRRICDDLQGQRCMEALACNPDLLLVKEHILLNFPAPRSFKMTPDATPKCLYSDTLMRL
jgi:hypothetical protein